MQYFFVSFQWYLKKIGLPHQVTNVSYYLTLSKILLKLNIIEIVFVGPSSWLLFTPGSPGFEPKYATDGLIPQNCSQPKSGCWLSEDNEEGEDWLQIDLNRTQFIQDITLDFRRDNILKSIETKAWENIQVLYSLSD